MGLISLGLSHVSELGETIDEVFGKNFSPYSEIQSLESIASVQLWLEKFFDKVIRHSYKEKMTKSKLLVMQVKDFINENLMDNTLNLNSISNEFYLNSSYLRKIFKKEMGLTITDYITQVRMQKAKYLLTSVEDMAISRISELTGFSDPSYFSKSFKNYSGLSPSEYANLKKRKSIPYIKN